MTALSWRQKILIFRPGSGSEQAITIKHLSDVIGKDRVKLDGE